MATGSNKFQTVQQLNLILVDNNGSCPFVLLECVSEFLRSEAKAAPFEQKSPEVQHIVRRDARER